MACYLACLRLAIFLACLLTSLLSVLACLLACLLTSLLSLLACLLACLFTCWRTCLCGLNFIALPTSLRGLILPGCGMATALVVPYSYTTDAAEFVDAQTGMRLEGTLFGVNSLMNKI